MNIDTHNENIPVYIHFRMASLLLRRNGTVTIKRMPPDIPAGESDMLNQSRGIPVHGRV
jgi:hypothetical protein